MANKRGLKKMTTMWSITQGPNETFEKYTKRFTAAYSCVTNPNEKFAIQSYIARVTNESVQLALCGNDVTDMEGLINKAYKLSNTQEMSQNRIPHITIRLEKGGFRLQQLATLKKQVSL